MKSPDKKFSSRLLCLLIMHTILIMHVACSKRGFRSSEGKQQKDLFLSASFNHFEGGVLFSDVEAGLAILWKSSFKGIRAYKENLGFFVNGGLLILPNKDNTRESASLCGLQTMKKGGKLYVKFEGTHIEVLGIVHTHPEIYSRPEPTPGTDYQYGNLGIHNYVMDHRNLYDAYKDTRGYEVYKRLGPRNAYHKIPLSELRR